MSAPVAKQRCVRDYMVSNPVTLSPEARLVEAILTMRTQNIRHLPVINEEKLVGLLTERDIHRLAPSVLHASLEEYNAIFEKTPVRTVMTKEVTTATPDMPLVEAVALMRQNKFGCLPVVENDRLAGILTATDVLGFIQDLLEEERMSLQADRRANPRISAQIPVFVEGRDVSGQYFREATRTTLISDAGALISLAAFLEGDALCWVTNELTGVRADCRIVWRSTAPREGRWGYGFTFISAPDNFWGLRN